MRVFLVGATGTIGRATVQALLLQGHEVVCFVRPGHAHGTAAKVLANGGATAASLVTAALAEWREGEATQPQSLARQGFRGERFDAVVSCLASRTGVPRDAWAIDHAAHVQLLHAASQAGVRHWVQLSALCVQKPLLAFQQAKLAFERELMASDLVWSIVRPTAFFKSLSGQVERVRQGKPFLVFGDGTLTACKPISDEDLGHYLAACLALPEQQMRVLPIGGPGEAITPRQQGEHLFGLLGREPSFRQVPVGLLDTIAATLGVLGRVWPPLADKAELARIGRYYATESMLVLNPQTGRYDAQATPSTGSQTLWQHYADLISGKASNERREHAVF
jgi:divinyl chlorophyllide a 8-vinyl-reductase